MRKIFRLAVTLLKSGAAANGKKKARSRWVLPVVIGFSFVIFAMSMTVLTMEMYDVLAAGGAADAILPLAMGAACIVVFIFGIFYTVSTMYHANDIEHLMALPLRPYQILGGKFITLVMYEYIMEAFILLPVIVGFGIKSGFDIMYVVYSVLLFIIVPVIPLVMASIIVMIVMRFTSFGKNKQMFKFVGGIIALALAVSFNVMIQSSASRITEEQIMAIATGQSSLVSVVGNIFPGTLFAANTLIFSKTMAGLGSFALFVLCSAGAAAVFLGIGQLVYIKGVSGVTETTAKRKELRGDALEKSTRQGTALRSYIVKELRLLVRSPIAFMNCVLMNFLWPVILIAIIIGRGGSIAGISTFIKSMDSGMVIAAIVGVSAFVASSNAVTSTAISREGKQFYFMKYIPMDMDKQLGAKITTGIMISAAGIIMLAIAAVILGLSIGTALIALVLGLAVCVVCALAGMLVDASRPKLNWMNEQQAIKQNINVLLHMLIGIAVAAAIVLPVLLAHMVSVYAVLYIAALMVLLITVLRQRIRRGAVRKLHNMDA